MLPGLPPSIQKKRNGDDNDKHQYHQKTISLDFSPTRKAKVKAWAIPRYRGRKSYAFHRRLDTCTAGHRSGPAMQKQPDLMPLLRTKQ